MTRFCQNILTSIERDVIVTDMAIFISHELTITVIHGLNGRMWYTY